MQHSERLSRPVMPCSKQADAIPAMGRTGVVRRTGAAASQSSVGKGLVRRTPVRGLGLLALDTREPIFGLGCADGVVGRQARPARDAGRDFSLPAVAIEASIDLLRP